MLYITCLKTVLVSTPKRCIYCNKRSWLSINICHSSSHQLLKCHWKKSFQLQKNIRESFQCDINKFHVTSSGWLSFGPMVFLEEPTHRYKAYRVPKQQFCGFRKVSFQKWTFEKQKFWPLLSLTLCCTKLIIKRSKIFCPINNTCNGLPDALSMISLRYCIS